MEINTPYKNYFEKYTALVPESNVDKALEAQDAKLNEFISRVSEENGAYAYREGKWTLKEMLQHLIDTERIFTYRALAIARKDEANLPGYDENNYADNSAANRRTWASLAAEIMSLRKCTKLLFQSFTEEMLASAGTFNNITGDVNTLGFIIVGHAYHHIQIAEEKYFPAISK